MDDRAFLQAIVEAPDDDAPRLMYADWLEERGEPRAAFIRAQCLLQRLDPGDPRRADLEDMLAELFAAHEAVWAAPLSNSVARSWRFRRGFVERISAEAQVFPAHAADWFAAFPLRELEFCWPWPDASLLADCPHLARLEVLALRGWAMRNTDLRVVLSSPHLSRLTELDLTGQGIEAPHAVELVQSPLLARLRKLRLGENRGFGDRAARALAAAPAAAGLTTLDLGHTNLTAHGVGDVLGSWNLTGLRELNLGTPGPRHLAPVFAERPTLPALAGLMALDLSGHTFGPENMQSLLASASGLTRLALRGCGLDASVAETMAAQGTARTALDLRDNRLGDEGLQTLARARRLSGLTELRLGKCRLQDTGVKALAQSKHVCGLTRLDLADNAVGGPGIRALAESTNFAGLRRLKLTRNYVGPASVQALAHSPSLAQLESLDLSGVQLDAAGIAALVSGPNCARLRTLRLADNRLGDESARALAASPLLKRLRTLDLRGNEIGAAGFQALADSPYLGRLRLELNPDELGPVAYEVVAERFGRPTAMARTAR